MKGHEPPTNIFQVWTQPSFGSEDFRIITIYALLSVHMVNRVSYSGVLWHKHGRFPIWSAATGKNGGFASYSHIKWQLRI